MRDDHKDYCYTCGHNIDESNKAEQFGIVEHNDEGTWKILEVVTKCQKCLCGKNVATHSKIAIF